MLAKEAAESYLGALGVGLVVVLTWLLQGCSSGIPRHASCDEAKVFAFTKRCELQVQMLCDKDPSVACPVEEECEASLCELCPLATECAK
jgi:hypothetical protein